MSGPESHQPDDQLLDEFLAGEGVVRAVYRESANERAPAHLDAEILRAAQAAARPLPRQRRPRWQTPMAAAAVMVLSFGVFLQVQRDPVVQREVLAAREPVAPAVAPTPLEAMPEVGKAELLNDSTDTLEETSAEKKQASAVAAKPKPQRRATAVAVPQQLAPPPAMAMADAPAPSVAMEASEPEIAAPDAAASLSAAGAVAATESMQRHEQLATAAPPPPVAKASRAPLTSNLMHDRAAPSSIASDTAVAAAIEQWARTCGAEAIALTAPTRWRGLAVTSWVRQADDQRMRATLLFAPDVSQEAITASLGSLAVKATLTAAQCAGPVTRELRQTNAGWALTCECGDQ